MHIPKSVNISSLGERQLVLVYFWAHLPHNLWGQVVYPAARYPQLILPPESTSAVTISATARGLFFRDADPASSNPMSSYLPSCTTPDIPNRPKSVMTTLLAS